MINDLFIQYNYENYSTIICAEEVGACYAYLMNRNQIVSDLWLFNFLPTPNDEQWKKSNTPPFLNSKKYSKLVNEVFDINSISENGFQIEFFRSDSYGIYSKIYINKKLIGVITENQKPGWSYFAKLNGPLANDLDEFNEK